MTDSRGVVLERLCFRGSGAENAELSFRAGLNVLFGASNTGKSFAAKAIDFMLGAARPLPDIEERRPYDRCALVMRLPQFGQASFVRSLSAGPIEFYPGDFAVPGILAGGARQQLSARHNATNSDNVSQFLLEELGLGGREIAIDTNGKKRPLSFRDLARFCIVDETAIQSENSPAESGQHLSAPAERRVFTLLVTGVDDASTKTVVDVKTFKASTTGKIEVLDEMIAALDEELNAAYPNGENLVEQGARLEETWRLGQLELQSAQDSVRVQIRRKRQLAEEILRLQSRRAEIQINIGRFEQLKDVYSSDIARLEAIEEAGFLLALGGDRPCPLCGASGEHQLVVHGLREVEQARDAARAEAEKIRLQGRDLERTLAELDDEGRSIGRELEWLDHELTTTETEISSLAPTADATRRRVEELQSVRDHVRKGLALIEQRGALSSRREELAALKPPKRSEKPVLGIPSTAAHEFAQKVSEVLTEWQFPGKRHVAFDEATYDLRIDGKARRDNGKGVRAITHAAFKVALLLHCRERNLPHPGFLVLDTPLLTYRDPMQSNDPLAADEQAIRNTSLKDFFFEHLSKNSDKGQFVIIENVELPPGIDGLAHVQTFTGDPHAGRAGLFLPKAV
jgi:hypothetical protein